MVLFWWDLRGGWILPGRPPQCPLVGWHPIVCSVVSPVQRWNQFPIRHSANLLFPQSELHDNAHEVVQLPRIFANICHIRDIQVNRKDFSIRANTYTPRDAIPSVVYVAVAELGQMVPTWKCGHFRFMLILFHRTTHGQSRPARAIQVAAVTKEPCSVNVILFHLTIVTLTAALRTTPLWYTLYLQPQGDQGARTSGQGGAHGARRLQLSMVHLSKHRPNYILE